MDAHCLSGQADTPTRLFRGFGFAAVIAGPVSDV